MLELHLLRSGDKGSCYAVRRQGAEDFVCVDCGINGKTFASACSDAGLVPFKLQAVLITHAHGNQTKGLRSTLEWLRKRGVNPPVYAAPAVREASKDLQELGDAVEVRPLEALQPFELAGVRVYPFRSFHNNEDKGGCYNFRFEELTPAGEGGDPDALAILSDAGVLSKQAGAALQHARLIAVECNYDPDILAAALKETPGLQRAVDVRGNFSNAQAATVVQTHAWEGVKQVVAMYLSRKFNTPELAKQALEEALSACGCPAQVTCALPEATVSVLPGDAELMTSCDGVEVSAEANDLSGQEPAPTGFAPCPLEAEDPGDGFVAPAGFAVPASEVDKSEATSDSSACPSEAKLPADAPVPTFEDILTARQACDAGFIDLAALLALAPAGSGPLSSPEAALQALVQAGLIDPADHMPTDKGIDLGIWAAFDPANPVETLRPVFFAPHAAQIVRAAAFA